MNTCHHHCCWKALAGDIAQGEAEISSGQTQQVIEIASYKPRRTAKGRDFHAGNMVDSLGKQFALHLRGDIQLTPEQRGGLGLLTQSLRVNGRSRIKSHKAQQLGVLAGKPSRLVQDLYSADPLSLDPQGYTNHGFRVIAARVVHPSQKRGSLPTSLTTMVCPRATLAPTMPMPALMRISCMPCATRVYSSSFRLSSSQRLQRSAPIRSRAKSAFRFAMTAMSLCRLMRAACSKITCAIRSDLDCWIGKAVTRELIFFATVGSSLCRLDC